MLKANKLFMSLVCFFLLLISMPPQARANETICLLDGKGNKTQDMPDCPTVTNNCGDQTTKVTQASLGLRLNPGTSMTPVDVHGKCRYLDNSGATAYFVPFNTSVEWFAFLSGKPSDTAVTHCARPFSGQDKSKGLFFGTTSAQFSMGDTGDPVTADVSLPYWRTGKSWPPSGSACPNTTKTFSNRCYEEFSQYKCWRWVNQTCTGSRCTATDPQTGACTATTTYSYDCSYCGDSGSTCEKRWHSWSETFNFVAKALDSDTVSPSWSGRSQRTSAATRPAQCNTRCTFTGHDCINCTNGPPTTCVPSGATTCVAGRRYDSCGKDIGACAACCCAYWGY